MVCQSVPSRLERSRFHSPCLTQSPDAALEDCDLREGSVQLRWTLEDLRAGGYLVMALPEDLSGKGVWLVQAPCLPHGLSSGKASWSKDLKEIREAEAETCRGRVLQTGNREAHIPGVLATEATEATRG